MIKFLLIGYAQNSGVRPVFVIPHEKVREDVEEEVGYDASIVFITTPGQVCISRVIVHFVFEHAIGY